MSVPPRCRFFHKWKEEKTSKWDRTRVCLKCGAMQGYCGWTGPDVPPWKWLDIDFETYQRRLEEVKENRLREAAEKQEELLKREKWRKELLESRKKALDTMKEGVPA